MKFNTNTHKQFCYLDMRITAVREKIGFTVVVITII